MLFVFNILLFLVNKNQTPDWHTVWHKPTKQADTSGDTSFPAAGPLGASALCWRLFAAERQDAFLTQQLQDTLHSYIVTLWSQKIEIWNSFWNCCYISKARIISSGSVKRKRDFGDWCGGEKNGRYCLNENRMKCLLYESSHTHTRTDETHVCSCGLCVNPISTGETKKKDGCMHCCFLLAVRERFGLWKRKSRWRGHLHLVSNRVILQSTALSTLHPGTAADSVW